MAFNHPKKNIFNGVSSSHQTKDATLTTAWLAIWALGFAIARRFQNRPQKVEVVQSWWTMDDGCWRWPSKQRGLDIFGRLVGKKQNWTHQLFKWNLDTQYMIYACVFFPLQDSVFFWKIVDSWTSRGGKNLMTRGPKPKGLPWFSVWQPTTFAKTEHRGKKSAPQGCEKNGKVQRQLHRRCMLW